MKHNIDDDLRLLKHKMYGNYHEVNAEIHITVNIDDSNEAEIIKFRETCQKHNIKVVVIDLLNGENFHIMTSERVRRPLHELCYVIKATLTDLWEFQCIRFKVEIDINSMTDDLDNLVEYYESHIDCDISTLEKYNTVKDFVIEHDYKLSRSLKQDIDVISVTKRYISKSNDIYNEYKFLLDQDIAKSKLEIECVIFDSNLELDANW